MNLVFTHQIFIRAILKMNRKGRVSERRHNHLVQSLVSHWLLVQMGQHVLSCVSILNHARLHFGQHVFRVRFTRESMDLFDMWPRWLRTLCAWTRLQPFQAHSAHVLDAIGQQSSVGLCGRQLCASAHSEQNGRQIGSI
jgi:hypothetical protein